MTPAQTPVTVTQADRDLAAEIFELQERWAMAELVRSGKRDTSNTVRAIARHRQSAAASSSAEMARLVEERDFLLARAGHAGSCSFSPGRWTGVSSNALVTIAFGGKGDHRDLPYDNHDLAACYRTVMRLPQHLLSDKVWQRLEAGEAFVAERYDIAKAKEAAGWPENARAALSHRSGGEG